MVEHEKMKKAHQQKKGEACWLFSDTIVKMPEFKPKCQCHIARTLFRATKTAGMSIFFFHFLSYSAIVEFFFLSTQPDKCCSWALGANFFLLSRKKAPSPRRHFVGVFRQMGAKYFRLSSGLTHDNVRNSLIILLIIQQWGIALHFDKVRKY